MCPVGPGFLPARIGALAGVCILIALAAPTRLLAQEGTETEFVIRSWDRREGLPPTGINDIQRAPNGYLWLATQRGLVRFDGERFKLFDTQVHPEFRTNRINCVWADSTNGVWIGTPEGLFHRADNGPGREKWLEIGSRLPVKSLAPGRAKAVWALCASNEVMEIVEERLGPRLKVPGDSTMRLLLRNQAGDMLVASRYNAVLRRAEQWLPLAPELSARVRPDIVCPSVLGGFWVAAGRNVARLVETEGKFNLIWIDIPGEAPQTPITALMEDHEGRLWAGTRQGAVFCCYAGAAAGVHPGARPGWRQVTTKRLRSLGSISCLYEDSEGLVWVATSAGYLHQIKHPLVTTWSLPTTSQKSVPHTVCVARDGAVWVGTDGAGAYRYQDGAIAHFSQEQGLANGTVITILQDRRTNLWFGTFGGLFRLENGHARAELDSLEGRPIPALFEDAAGALWVGTEGAVIRKRGQEVSTFSLGSAFENSEVRAIAEGRQGELWIGTRGGGIFRFRNDRVEKFERFRHPRVHAMHADAKGNLWVGTATRGLFRVAGNRIYNWSRADGLPSSWIDSVLEDSNGTLWLGSNEGIFGVTKQGLMARERSKESPLLTIQVATSQVENWSAASGQPSAAKGPDGRLWFPVGHGVLSFHPAELMRPRPALPVLIEEFLVDGVERWFDITGPLKVYTGVKRLEFRYTIADLDSPGRLKFRYKLEGLDERWVDAGAQRSATYGPLPPGKYRFRVISAGSANVWTETANPLSIEIVPHVWQTAWFRAVVGTFALCLVGAVAVLVGRAKLRRRVERLELKDAMEKERQRIAQDLHDDLGSSISEIVFLSELARQEQNNATGQVGAHLDNITQKTRQIATAMDEIVWTVNPKNDSLPDLASYLCDYAREFLRAADIGCRIDMAEGLPTVPLTAQQRHNLFMAVKEALNNAVKHSGGAEVWLRIARAPGRAALTVSVEDNGRGFDPALELENGSGNGLSNMRTRLDAIGGRVDFASGPGQGTKISFTLLLPAGALIEPAESLN